MLSVVDKFSTTSMDEVMQVNNILGSIADPLPKESQDGAVAAMEALAGAADSTAPLAQQRDFAAGALGTTASLLKVNVLVFSSSFEFSPFSPFHIIRTIFLSFSCMTI